MTIHVRRKQKRLWVFHTSTRSRKKTKQGVKTQIMPVIRDIVEVQFKKGNTSIFVKKSFEDEYVELNFLKNKFVKVGGASTFPQPVTQRRGITSQKKKGQKTPTGPLFTA